MYQLEDLLERLWRAPGHALRRFADDLVTLIARTKLIIRYRALIAALPFYSRDHSVAFELGKFRRHHL